MGTLDLQQAARFLRMHPEQVRRRAKLGLLPGAKPGKAWIFLEEDLVAYVRAAYAGSWQALQVTSFKEQQPCHSTNAKACGGSTSPHHQESALDVLLKQASK
ncbi:helix-turn-helix domain-containing protein [Pseudoduganella sp. GCM10020061]|uniref:helix-turn-helix domain-containing protein n=1 Tax=Pseudoduganella sp. GCM10020061 TaxID=3317345 RepID=UPI003641971F